MAPVEAPEPKKAKPAALSKPASRLKKVKKAKAKANKAKTKPARGRRK